MYIYHIYIWIPLTYIASQGVRGFGTLFPLTALVNRVFLQGSPIEIQPWYYLIVF